MPNARFQRSVGLFEPARLKFAVDELAEAQPRVFDQPRAAGVGVRQVARAREIVIRSRGILMVQDAAIGIREVGQPDSVLATVSVGILHLGRAGSNRAAVLLGYLDQLSETVVLVLDIVDNASLADGGVVVAGHMLHHATNLVAALDAADQAVHPRSGGGHPVLNGPP